MFVNINNVIEESIHAKERLKDESNTIEEIGLLISSFINWRGTDAQHISAELIGRYQVKRKGLPSIALTTNSSVLTAIGNDFGYEFVFERQVESLVDRNDVVVGISTSGNSPNITKAIIASKKIGAKTV